MQGRREGARNGDDARSVKGLKQDTRRFESNACPDQVSWLLSRFQTSGAPLDAPVTM